MSGKPDEVRDGVNLTNLDAALFDGAGATKRDLVDYLDAVRDRILPVLAGRPLSVIRVHRGQEAFMQKNVPKYTPEWVRTVKLYAEASHRDVAYALCDDRRTLLWFANQRAVEYHPALVKADRLDHVTDLVLDLDPPEGADFAAVVVVAQAVRDVLDQVGLAGAVKTSGAKGIHIFVPVTDDTAADDLAAAARALAVRAAALLPDVATTAFVKADRGGKVFVDSTRVGGATVVAAYSPRVRPGTPVSFPVTWDELESVAPSDFTVHTALDRLGDGDPWAEQMPPAQTLPDDVVAEGHEIRPGRGHARRQARARAGRARGPGERPADHGGPVRFATVAPHRSRCIDVRAERPQVSPSPTTALGLPRRSPAQPPPSRLEGGRGQPPRASMRARRLTLVAALRGMASTISIDFGTLYGASRALA